MRAVKLAAQKRRTHESWGPNIEFCLGMSHCSRDGRGEPTGKERIATLDVSQVRQHNVWRLCSET
ncbi:hypothetical protein D9M68_165220 [compost metagenome]